MYGKSICPAHPSSLAAYEGKLTSEPYGIGALLGAVDLTRPTEIHSSCIDLGVAFKSPIQE